MSRAHLTYSMFSTLHSLENESYKVQFNVLRNCADLSNAKGEKQL